MSAMQNPTHPSRLLTFRMGNEHFGVPIGSVQEIRRYETPTRIAQAPAHVRGVVNLRGTVVPVIDLGKRLGYAHPINEPTAATVMMVTARRTLGFVVDEVSDVIELTPANQTDTRAASHTLAASMIVDMARHEDQDLAILDLTPLFDELTSPTERTS